FRGIVPVRLADHPTRVLQAKVVEERTLDGVLFHGARFDGEGRLVLEGLVAHESQRPGVDKLLDAVAAEKPMPPWLRPRPAERGKPWVLIMPDWSPLAMLQAELAGGLNIDAALREVAEQTLVRRVWFAYGKDPRELKCWVEAVSIAPTFQKETHADKFAEVF